MKYRFKLFSSQNEEMEEFEELMTRAYEGTEVEIIQKESKLTEMGEYLIAVHWIESGSSSEDKKRIQELIEEGV